jgi:hypothetical protein
VRGSEGLSGRALRKLALRAWAYHIKRPSASLLDLLHAMDLTLSMTTADGFT